MTYTHRHNLILMCFQIQVPTLDAFSDGNIKLQSANAQCCEKYLPPYGFL